MSSFNGSSNTKIEPKTIKLTYCGGAISIINKTPEDLDFAQKILNKSVPTYRQAYSDRTAWIMSCLAELAYVRFNPLIANETIQNIFNENIDRLIKDSKRKHLNQFLRAFSYDASAEKALLESDLNIINLKLDKTFDTEGTQAIIASTDNFVVLSFRGTESTSPKDIKADFKANKVFCTSGGMVHSGFKTAYEQVSLEIQKTLELPVFENKPLFITGHSLGGALATIASKRLTHSAGIAACYSFGSPRVGDAIWMSSIKTPIYRIVNAADCVTMMPPGGVPIAIASKLLDKIPYCRPFSNLLQTKYGGYIHGGNMRYLTNCENGNFESVSLLYSVSWLYRVMGIIKYSLAASKTLTDHSMATYRKKLTVIARKRNLD